MRICKKISNFYPISLTKALVLVNPTVLEIFHQDLCRQDKSPNFGKSYICQIKPKADWRTVDSPKNRTNKFGLFVFCFSWQTKPIFCSIFGRIYGAPNLLSVLSDL